LMVVTFTGRLTAKEYALFLPHFESEIRHYAGLRVLFDLRDLDGWCPSTGWRKLTYDSRQRTDLLKIAIVGSPRRTMWMKRACLPLSYKEMKRCLSRDFEDALNWVGQ
jgi:hypothetical protein